MMKRLTLSLALLLAPTLSWAQVKLETIASMSIVGDLVHQVGGARVNVITLVAAGGDAHTFQPSPNDARRMAQARLVFINGLGLEGWLPRLAQASGSKAMVITLSKGVQVIGRDPHAWQDVANAKIYIANIVEALSEADPDGAPFYKTRGDAYRAELDRLDADIRAKLAQITPERRRVITSHDAFGYFAKAYGMSFIAPQGVSTEAEVSSRDVARIIRQIRVEKIPAIFLENISDPRLMNQIARETGAKIGAPVFSDSLSPASGKAPTYLDMMRNNLDAFTQALH